MLAQAAVFFGRRLALTRRTGGDAGGGVGGITCAAARGADVAGGTGGTTDDRGGAGDRMRRPPVGALRNRMRAAIGDSPVCRSARRGSCMATAGAGCKDGVGPVSVVMPRAHAPRAACQLCASKASFAGAATQVPRGNRHHRPNSPNSRSARDTDNASARPTSASTARGRRSPRLREPRSAAATVSASVGGSGPGVGVDAGGLATAGACAITMAAARSTAGLRSCAPPHPRTPACRARAAIPLATRRALADEA